MRKTKFGYIKDGNYIRIGDNMHGIYKTYDDMRFNWQLVSQTEGDITKYYLLNNKNEAIEYVGRKDPWSPLTVGTKEQYLYMDNAQGSMQDVNISLGKNANSRATASIKPSMEKNAL